MAVVVSCQCGKLFRAKDKYAGKRAKCLGCGTILRLPDMDVIAAEIPEEFRLSPADLPLMARPASPMLTIPDPF